MLQGILHATCCVLLPELSKAIVHKLVYVVRSANIGIKLPASRSVFRYSRVHTVVAVAMLSNSRYPEDTQVGTKPKSVSAKAA